MKRLLVLILFILSITSPLYAGTITDLTGVTGKVGYEDIYWLDGTGTPTFTVPTYSGSTITLTKVTPVPGIDVRRYGAKGDGTTDDAVGLQAAITAAAGVKPVILINGIWITGTKLTAPSGTTLLGFGKGITTIKQKTGSNLAAILENSDTTGGNSNITIRGITFDGNRANQTGGAGVGFHGHKITDLIMEDFEIKNTYGYGTDFYLLNRASFTRWKMSNNTGTGFVAQGSHILIDDFYSDQTSNPGEATQGDGVAVGTGVGASINSDHVVIRNGTVIGCPAIGVQMAADFGLIENVWAYSNGRLTTASGIDIARSNGVTVRKCHSYSNSGHGICNESQTPDDANMIQAALTIEDNICRSNGTSGIYLLQGTGLMRRLIIRGNRTYSNTGPGIIVSSTDVPGVTEALISENFSWDNTGSGIAITAVTYAKITDNWSFGTAPAGQAIGMYVNTCGVHFGHNRVYNNTANYAYAGTNTVDWINGLNGTVTVNTTATTGVVTFTALAPQADASYFLSLVPVASVGTPAAGSNRILSISKLTTGFTITVEAAPGGGNSVTFDWHLTRN